jgi:hypothetical protein
MLARCLFGASAQLYPLTVLTDNPSAYWRLDETNGTIANDLLGGHDCFFTNVLLNVAGYSPADADTAAAFGIFSSSNSYAGELDLSGNGIAKLNFAQPPGSNAEFTVEAWVKGGAQTVNAGIIVKGNGNGGEQFNLDTGSSAGSTQHGFRFSIHDAGGTNYNAASTAAPDGSWHHLVGVCDQPQGVLRLYIDGLDNVDNTNLPTVAGILATTNGAAPGSARVSIGAKTTGAGATGFANQFVGTIDEVALYRYALSASQVQAHYEAGLAAVRFTNASAHDGKFILNASGGLSNGVCTVLASTNPAVALANWTAVATNNFDAGGRFAFTNSISASVPQQFFALQSAPSSALWIPPCGAWLGAEVTGGLNSLGISNHEANIGRQLDVLRGYHTLSNWTNLDAIELNYINAGRKLLLSLKPAPYWSNAVGVAHGGSAAVDAELTSLALSVASIKPRKVMLCVWHEPENDVLGTSNGTAGTPEQYVAMWSNVRAIFDANAATNVLWCWIVINSGPSDRDMLAGLWPGNSCVDWIGWDVYQSTNNEDYVATQLAAYSYLVNSSDSNHTYTAKPWAWTEWGVGTKKWAPSAADQTNTFNAVKNALNARLFPRIRYAAYFDDYQTNGTQSPILPGAWGSYSNLANSPYPTQQIGH